ncbi:HlyD family efflux transporter periplasmic adaptor subunit [Aquimarina sp. AD10]|uniref:Efflux transporter periplasmic adaptor subunit n=1 Tax=Aquimarina aggregata TaxID=1642818 RepID=A0A163D2D3_9FLAO|nr:MULTISPECIES: HlyD family efflux transporter periplasmic adaptor subunit [Aquimarina]AXT62631.1 HlyD family efflux transporter periplasmic adaptor subunit [Aquimarina sp. AD10]KZS42942.1 efflux transporter periplasmic adaptor subunit [Aquimarina aggregata]RKM98373.1 HlyD family efflux transporter periplasmic adaptor subunit [Aquimarina sp. AD10]
MRNIILSILGVVIIIGALFGAKKIVDSKKRPKPRSSKVVKTVFVDTVQNTTIPIQIAANGNLTAKRRLELYAEVQGVFKGGAKLFKTGQKYQKGQSLIRIDASEYYATVQSAKSNLYNQVTAIMPDLRLDYPEIYQKWQAYLGSFDMDKATPQLPETTSEKEKYFITGRNIYTSYYNVKNLEQRLSKYSIRAPFSGVLTESLVTEGTLIRQGQKLGEYIDTSVYEMQVAIGKEYADLLRIGKSVALSNLNKTKSFKGTVTRINGSIDQATQTITAFIEIKDPLLKEGMYLEAYLDAKKEENAIQIDRSLLQEGDKIFIVRDSILDVINVNPVYFSDKKVVLKGVSDGDVIVNKPVPGAYAGMLVKIYQKKNSSESRASNANASRNIKQ